MVDLFFVMFEILYNTIVQEVKPKDNRQESTIKALNTALGRVCQTSLSHRRTCHHKLYVKLPKFRLYVKYKETHVNYANTSDLWKVRDLSLK